MDNNQSFSGQKENRSSPAQASKAPVWAIISILILLILLVAGVIFGYFWNQQLNEYRKNQLENENQIKSLQQKLDNHGKGSASNLHRTSQFSFTLPTGWKATTDKQTLPGDTGETPIDAYIISSPNGDMKLKYYFGPGGLGGGCDVSEQISLKSLGSQKLTDPKFASPTYYTELLAPSINGKYIVWFGLSDKADMSGGPVCQHLASLFTQLNNSKENILYFGSGLTYYDKEFNSEAEAREFFKSSDYLSAKKIILSMKSN